jgi:hypothetical protein
MGKMSRKLGRGFGGLRAVEDEETFKIGATASHVVVAMKLRGEWVTATLDRAQAESVAKDIVKMAAGLP